MNISMRVLARTIRRAITVVIPVAFVVVPSNLSLEIRDRVLQTIQLATEHVKLSPTDSDKGGTRSRTWMLSILGCSHERCRSILLDILPLVRWVI